MGLDGRLIGKDDEQFGEYQDLLSQFSKQLNSKGLNWNGASLGTVNGTDYVERIGHYSGVQLLRTYAAHVAVHGEAPAESNQFVIGPELNQMYNGERDFKPFQHLIDHSDAEGYYVPVDFSDPVHFEVPQIEGDGTWTCDLGSSNALLRELDELNKHLQMPGDYGDIGGFDKLNDLLKQAKFGNEKWVWAVMRWLARESVEKNLLFEFC